jgi:threonine synthase
MKYLSTRNTNPNQPMIGFGDMVFTGTAPNGGLYMPHVWPDLSYPLLEDLRAKPYVDVAEIVLTPFCVGPDLSAPDLKKILHDVYGPNAGVFRDPAIAPVRQLDNHTYLLELFHGPTLAFKDIALQLLGRIFDHLLQQKQNQITIIGATSGDTGSAAIHACKGLKNARIVILHPAGRVSEIQRRQMTTTNADNVTNIAIDGTFDDCQDLVKALFADEKLSRDLNFTAVNSINWLRISAQIVYYITSALACGGPGREVSFAVPTGNFGNVLAAYAARLMGLPVRDLVIGSNQNDILTRFFATGEMAIDKVTPSLSPSMDIQISSNFERFLFELLHRDTRAINFLMTEFKDKGVFRLAPADHACATKIFSAYRADDDATIKTMRTVYEQNGIIIDPHTAVGLYAARAHQTKVGTDTTMIALACAHPAKFPDAVTRAIGRPEPLPEFLATLMTRVERVTPMRKDYKIVSNFIRNLPR